MLAQGATYKTPPDLPSYLFKERIIYLVCACPLQIIRITVFGGLSSASANGLHSAKLYRDCECPQGRHFANMITDLFNPKHSQDFKPKPKSDVLPIVMLLVLSLHNAASINMASELHSRRK
jgi:hypothetical protein